MGPAAVGLHPLVVVVVAKRMVALAFHPLPTGHCPLVLLLLASPAAV